MKKLEVGILGATGMVGQRFIELLATHPWFKIGALAASDRSVGKSFQEAIKSPFCQSLPEEVSKMKLIPCDLNLPCRVLFSALDSSVAGEIEESLAKAGYIIISNSRNHRMDPDVPLIIPEVNSGHLKALPQARFGKGAIITNPNCSVIGLTTAFKPLIDQWGLEAAHVVTLQALSGAGYPGVASLDILDNVIPFIAGEEEKIETEPLKILGDSTHPYPMRLSAQCTRVAVTDGHMACVSVKLKKRAEAAEIIAAWRKFMGPPQLLKLPTAPERPIQYFDEENYPQPKLHRHLGKGMAVSIGRLQRCPLLDWKFVLLSHNTLRGAAGGTLLIAEFMYQQGLLNP